MKTTSQFPQEFGITVLFRCFYDYKLMSYYDSIIIDCKFVICIRSFISPSSSMFFLTGSLSMLFAVYIIKLTSTASVC